MMRTRRARRSAAASVVVGAVLASTLGASLPAAADESAAPQPIVSYPFDDGTLRDAVGSTDLTASGTAAVVADPERGGVLHVDGTANGFAEFPRGFFDGRDAMTVSMDVKSEKSSGNFFTFAFGADTTRYSFLRVRGGEVRNAITEASWQNESAVTGTVASGAWHHYDLVFDGTKMTVYVDGAKLGENPALSATVSALGTDLVGYLGKSLYAADAYFAGSFDDVQVFDRALSASEVLTIAGATDQLTEVSLVDPAVLKIAPIVNGATHTAILPVKPGTDVSALAPTFGAATGVTVAPASGTTVDLSSPVTYTLTDEAGATATWTVSAQVMNSPVLPGLYADPNIAVFGDTYYLYATTDGTPGWGGKDFFVWKSADLVSWTRSADPILTLDGTAGDVPWASGNAWAPTIIERGGKYYFYFSGHNTALNRKTIGVAVADDPEGPFTAQPNAMILNNEAVASGQAIDPAAFLDPVTGRYYLFWGNGSPVYAELGDDMTSLKPGTIARISGLTSFREGSFVNYRDGVYHLTYSIDDTGSENYRVGYATSTSVDGPWTYRGVILQKDLSLGIKGTGHSSIVNVPGTDDWFIAYHRFAMPNGDGTHRETTIDRLEIGADGLFQTVRPTLTSVAPQPVASPIDVSAVASTRCAAGRAVLVVTVTNETRDTTGAVDVRIETAYGAKRLDALAAGDAGSASFSTRLPTLPAGTATVTATAAGAAPASDASPPSPLEVAFAARSCG
ncbi:family 43 glycosylhydrolase [Agromyces endophyticus]|uniref:family 43 glycosylhydrolase n=1 Tax=Agromyces sp. H17E-10 TaxID=2932244 RepID=UPI001FD46E8A|nr:family 43 glycosylhydrolase [Agromyces sp. H17E-10]UOQ90563.1 family 43 glycosylhydrolase [Agromyces sp. H17E-10]